MRHLHAIIAGKPTAKRGAVAAACALTAALACAPGVSKAQTSPEAMTPAATMIDNVAALTFTDKAGPQTLSSNRVSLQVQEIVDVSVETLTPEIDVEADAYNQRLAFRIRNLGNGREAFDLSLMHVDDEDFDPDACEIIVDWDGDGLLDMTKDRVTSTTPVLAPGQAVVAWVSCHIPSNARIGGLGRIRLRAFPTALRNGATEGDMSHAGNGGVFMVLGRNLRGGANGTGGATSPPAAYRVGQVDARLIKSQDIVDQLEDGTIVAGTIVTYILEARIGTGAAARQARITDAIPTGASYLDGSMTLDGAPLSDADDGDAGRFANGAIEVELGDLAIKSSRTVTFKVRINPNGSTE